MANNPIVNMFRVKEIRGRIFFTLIVLAVFRLGSVLTIPGINPEALTSYFRSATGGANSFVDYMDFFAKQAEEAKKVAEDNILELAQILDFPTDKSEVANVAHGA